MIMQEFKAYGALRPNGPLEPFSFDPGHLGPEEVEIKESHCGLCHSDLSMLDNKWGCGVHAFTTCNSKETEARQLGAHYVHNSRKDGALKKLGRSLDLIISTINAPPDVSAFLDSLAPEGSFHNVGAVLKPLEVPAFGLILGQKSVAGSPTGSPTAIDHMLEFSARHSVAPVVEYFPMSKVNDALERLRSGKARYRIVLINDFDKSRSTTEARAKEQPEAALAA